MFFLPVAILSHSQSLVPDPSLLLPLLRMFLFSPLVASIYPHASFILFCLFFSGMPLRYRFVANPVLDFS